MHRTVQYILLFVILILLQAFLFSRLGISVYVNPLVYIAFIVLLPMEIAGAYLLGLAFLLGMSVDMLMGTAGLHTIATVFAAFCRPFLLFLFVGKDEVREGGVPNVNRLGIAKYSKYTVALILLHGITFFLLEALNWHYLPMTLIRVVASGVVTFAMVYLCQRLFVVNRKSGYGKEQ